jgi:NADH-quinone oxidoreductase subunit J
VAAAGAEALTNTEQIGRVLYTKYVYFFQAAGLVLLVAMIGAIVLTLRHREGVKRQSIPAQNARTPAAGLEVVKVAPGGAIVPSAEGPR